MFEPIIELVTVNGKHPVMNLCEMYLPLTFSNLELKGL